VQIVPTFLLIGVVVFILAHLLPGDPVSAMLGDKATDEAVERIKEQLGLNRSLWIQFWLFVGRSLRGDFGTSIAFREPVLAIIGERLPVTLMLTGMATVLAIVLAVPLAFIAATSANRWPDYLIRGLFQIGLSSPIFYVGLILLIVLAAGLRWFPVGGYGDTWPDRLYHLFLPALTLALSFAAVIMRNLRAAIIETLTADFVDFARAKGLPFRLILARHVFPNALISTITLVGLQVGFLLGGAVITESVFAVPGVGRLMVDSIFARDYAMIEALTLILAVLVSLVFLASDLLQMWLDPRVAR
jgi:peptide/nickel transport system permease protein